MWGEGRMDSMAYDTSWLARLGDLAPDLSLPAREWLRVNQHPDGTWGSDYVHAHDRVISTLASVIALREVGDCRADEEQVQKGLRALPRYIAALAQEHQDTIGYEVIATALISHAQRLGLNVPQLPINTEIIFRKVNALHRYIEAGRPHPILHSAEALTELIREDMDWYRLIDWDGAVAGASAATIAIALRSGRLLDVSHDILSKWRNPDGGIGTAPIEIMEIAWVLEYRQQAPKIEYPPAAIERLLADWNNDYGARATAHYSFYDLDTTASVFGVLVSAGYALDPGVFEHYLAEDGSHFWCLSPDENGLSLAAHARMLSALRAAGFGNEHQYVAIALDVVRSAFNAGQVWADKWQVSPCYLRGLILQSLVGWDKAMCDELARWFLEMQSADGGWGTAEETAFAICALAAYQKWDGYVPGEVFHRAEDFLAKHGERPALWISKGLYYPSKMIEGIVSVAQDLCASASVSGVAAA